MLKPKIRENIICLILPIEKEKLINIKSVIQLPKYALPKYA